MGAIYMVLTFSIMVPMALLTDAIINYLSAELQSNDADLQVGVQAALVQSLLNDSCQDLVDRGIEIEEVLVGDAKRDAEGFDGGKIRYFILSVQPDQSEQTGVAYVLRGLTNQDEQPNLSVINMLPSPGEACTNYQAPIFSRYDVCPVPERNMLNRTSASWRWQWLEDGELPSTTRDYLYCPDGLLLTSK